MPEEILFANLPEDRYDRQRRIAWWDQQRLAQAHVIVAGVGALGNEVLKSLALLGVGHILLVDFDTVSPSNLARMVLFHPEDIGQLKVEVAARRLRELNPDLEVRTINGDLHVAIGLGEFRAADLVFGCLDSVNARWALNRKCRQAGVEWIDAGISDFHAQVTRYHPTQGACYECTFTAETYERFNRRYSCPFGLRLRNMEGAVPTTAITTSLAAAIQVQEGLLSLHGIEANRLQPGQRLSMYLSPYRLLVDSLPENSGCLAHDPLPAEIEALQLSPGACPQDAFQMLQCSGKQASCLELPFDLLTEFVCESCGGRQPVLKPKQLVYQDEAACPTCKAMRTPQVTNSIEPGTELSHQPFERLGIPNREVIAFQISGERVYYQVEGANHGK